MNTKVKIGGLLLILGIGLFVGGAVGYVTGHLPAEQISGIGALALIFVGVGAGTTKAKQSAGGMKMVKNDFFTKNRVKTALRVGLATYFFVNGNGA